MTDDTPVRTALYRLHDAGGCLLYIGIANDPERRWLEHAASKGWWSQVDRQDVQWWPSRPEAEAAETAAIRAERPLHNRSKSLDRKRAGKDTWRVPVTPENYPHLSTIQRESLADLCAASIDYELYFDRREDARTKLHSAIAYALRVGVGPSEVTRRTPYDRQHVGRVGRAAGIPPRPRPGQKTTEGNLSG